MGRAKKSLLAVSSFVLSAFILFFQIVTTAITSLARPWGPLKQSLLHLIKVRNSLSKGLAEQYVQVIANSSISLMLAFAIAHFQPQFIRILVFISLEVHQKFLGVLAEVPKLSVMLQESQVMRNGLYYSYFLFGFLGISTQCILTVDLLSLASVPTVIFYRLTVKMLKACMKLFQNMRHILAIDKEVWLSCQYYQALLRDSFKVIYLCSIPVLCYAMAGLSVYAASLVAILLALRVASNIIINLALALDQVGFMLCLLKQSTRKAYQEATLRQQLEARAKTVNWVPLLTLSMFWQTLGGCCPLGEENSSFSCLSSLVQGREWLRGKLELLRGGSEG